MKMVFLTQNKISVVDDEDYDKVRFTNWGVIYGPNTYYAYGWHNLKRIMMHRVIIPDVPVGFEIDHKDGDGWNNQKYNLRIVTRSINNFNNRLSRQNKTGVKGVCWYPNYQKWRAFIKINGKQITLIYTESFEEAVIIRKNAEQQLLPEPTVSG